MRRWLSNFSKVYLACLVTFSTPWLVSQEQAAAIDTGDTAWILASSALVLLMMLPGLAMFYSGLVRQKNVISVFFQCSVLLALLSLIWAVIGYTLAFGSEGSFLGDFSRFFLLHTDRVIGSIPESVFAFFQMMFAAITVILIVGAYVERVKLSALLLFSSLWLLVVYVPVAHWIWGGGFLAQWGVLDFAGGLVVHATAGIAAVLFVIKLGSRIGFPAISVPASPLMTGIGGGLLWVGWMGFNGGSALSASGAAGQAILATHLSACAGMLTWLLLDWKIFGKSGVITAMTGMIAGLATVTPAAGFISPGSGILLGILGGLICYGMVLLMRGKFQFDDSLDVFAVHGVGGIVGAILLAPLSMEILGGSQSHEFISQLWLQILGTLIVLAWSVAASWIVIQLTHWLIPLRVDADVESEGLDSSVHGERSYNT